MADLAERSPTQQLVAQIRSDAFQQQVALALPSHIRPERFVRATVTAILQNPEVATHPESLFNAAIRAAQDGLLPDGREAAFVMFKDRGGVKKVVYMPMVGGFRKIAAKHGMRLVAAVVHKGDRFEWSMVPPAVSHIPELDAGSRGEIVCAYAAAFDRDWRFVAAPVVMNVAEIEKVRAVSRAKDSGPWTEWWERMACKTVARRLFHELPLGDLEEGETRIVEQADVDADLDAPAMTADEADVVARLSGALPPSSRPDDRAPAATVETADQAFAAALDRLAVLVPDTDWVATAERAAAETHGKEIAALNGEELDLIVAQMCDVADKLEAAATPK